MPCALNRNILRRKNYQYMYDAFGRRAVLSSDAPNPLLIIFLLASIIYCAHGLVGRENCRCAVATGLAGREGSRHVVAALSLVFKSGKKVRFGFSPPLFVARPLCSSAPVFHGIWNCAFGGILALTEYVLQNLIIRWKSPAIVE